MKLGINEKFCRLILKTLTTILLNFEYIDDIPEDILIEKNELCESIIKDYNLENQPLNKDKKEAYKEEEKEPIGLEENRDESDHEEQIVFVEKDEYKELNGVNNQKMININEIPPEIYVPIKDAKNKPNYSLYHENKALRKTVLPLYLKLLDLKHCNRVIKNVFKTTF